LSERLSHKIVKGRQFMYLRDCGAQPAIGCGGGPNLQGYFSNQRSNR